jgi:hypothetical protein
MNKVRKKNFDSQIPQDTMNMGTHKVESSKGE